MAQNTLIARAGRGLLDVLTLLMRGVGALCAAFGSLLLVLFSADRSGEDPSSEDALEDGLSIIEREDEATVSGWKSW
tara:strand:- start:39956 stop:40186 length:231 start_codon:yes stop_codon:yes gene_type:complete